MYERLMAFTLFKDFLRDKNNKCCSDCKSFCHKQHEMINGCHLSHCHTILYYFPFKDNLM